MITKIYFKKQKDFNKLLFSLGLIQGCGSASALHTRIRIQFQLFTLMQIRIRVRIQLSTLVQVRIRVLILLLIKVMRIRDTGLQTLHGSILSL